jgi:serine/threonine-protein kinase HipA
MHLKNFSLLTSVEGETTLSPAYDLVCTKLALPDDKDETGLTINARKRRLTRKDFDSLAGNLKIPARTQQNMYDKFAKKFPDVMQWIDISFLPQAMKDAYSAVLKENAAKMGPC